MAGAAVYGLEVDVVRQRDVRPWVARTHYVTVVVDEHPSLEVMDNEARNLAVWMVWHVRGDMVTGARIVTAEV